MIGFGVGDDDQEDEEGDGEGKVDNAAQLILCAFTCRGDVSAGAGRKADTIEQIKSSDAAEAVSGAAAAGRTGRVARSARHCAAIRNGDGGARGVAHSIEPKVGRIANRTHRRRGAGGAVGASLAGPTHVKIIAGTAVGAVALKKHF